MQRRHVYISGLVQGVYFRVYTREAAMECGVVGWVRNLRDGRVEAVFEGDDMAVDKMLKWCWIGSPPSRVEAVEALEEPYRGEFEKFTIESTV